MAIRLCDETLEELQFVMEDDFPQFLKTYLADSHERINSLADIILRGDVGAVKRAAHSFKGSARNVGTLSVADHCDKIESLAANNAPIAQLEDQLLQLQACFQASSQALQRRYQLPA